MYQLTVFLHILAAAVWIGGIIFLAAVAIPIARQLEAPLRAGIVTDFGQRFRIIGWSALAVLLVTGTIAAGYRGATLQNVLDGSYWSMPIGRTLAEKLSLVMLMVTVSAVHDFVIGPRAARLQRAGQDVARLRAQASWLARLTLILALGVLFMAVMLVRPGLMW